MEFFGTINSVYVLIGSVFLGALGGAIGVFAVLRKQGLIGDVVAHSALPGVVIGFLIIQEKFLPGLLFGGLISGLVAAFFVFYLVKSTKIKNDSAMATTISVFFGIGVVLLSYLQNLPNADQSGLDSFFFGNAAGLLRSDIYLIGGISLMILLMIILFWKELKVFTFNPRFAEVQGFKREILEFIFLTIFVLTILISLQAVGVILTAAIFITPAVAALLWSNKLLQVVVLSAFFGSFAGGAGTFVSANFSRIPTGPAIVLFLTLIFVISLFLGSKKGLLRRFFRLRKFRFKTEKENFLAKVYRQYERDKDSSVIELEFLNSKKDIKFLKKLTKQKYFQLHDNYFSFTEKGLHEARKIIEKHRLWETYLVNRMNLADDHVHRDAHDMEHLLTDDLVKKLKKILNNPKKDPHGKSIS